MNKALLITCIGIAAAGLFVLLSVTRLDAQGLYYDELHQATASFAYIGNIPYQNLLYYRGIPIMNLSYSGALKSGVYGLYLRIFQLSFSVISWRLVGILFVSLGLLMFGLLVRKRLPVVGAASFYAFLLTDLTVLVTTRHDWGPVALALFLRLVLIGVWLQGELSRPTRAWNSFWLGLLVGISLFEKLSAVVLLVPLLAMLLFSESRRNLRHLLAMAAGGLVGVLPLIFANWVSYRTDGYLVSLQFKQVQQATAPADLLEYLRQFLSLGNGELARAYVLGNPFQPYNFIEPLLLSALLLASAYFLIRYRRASIYLRLAGVMLVTYLAVFLSLPFLPQRTWIHHWVIATPFQYVAIALFLVWLVGEKRVNRQALAFYGVSVLLVCYAAFRLVGVGTLEQAYLRGDSGELWDPSLTRIGEFAGQHVQDAAFVAANWGVGNQLSCFLNGERGELLRAETGKKGIDGAAHFIRSSPHGQVYLVIYAPPSLPVSDALQKYLQDVEQAVQPEWREQPVENEIADLKNVRVIKLVRNGAE